MSSNMPPHDPHASDRHEPAAAAERNAGTDPSAGYERRDVNIRALLWFAAAIVIGSAVVMAGSLSLRDHFERVAKSNDPEISPLAEEEQIPPAPNLQDRPNRDFAEFRRSKEKTLASYGWIDRSQGVVQIPVDRAMDLLLERGLPAPTGLQSPTTEEPSSDSQDPSSSDRPMPENRESAP
jgi:hypothetical protein